ncbi:uncharacterized protein [Physcomitrium patens]|uniref:uncharacterized protein isoform X3 n=1 Tax=Physcomitrium patens TaxID=3218 RepID=UPI000D176F1B|nr:leucine-rich repeat-containing protein 9-like isoform X2 [Physcomitrium patens]|eukprot:XP_024365341.1 leucine-rich repeat-containing protein 9-like isoform X2 [Physcomitrella patens]
MLKNLKDILRYVPPEENEGETIDPSEDPTFKTRKWPISRRYMESALQDICEYNDISEEQLVSAPETITSIEMFLYNFPHICCMSFFPNLVSLSLVQQNLLSIEGLHHCPHLELLRLSENSIQRMEGLGNCLKLKELFLHSNRINRISGIAHLTNLEVLWLSNNEILNVEGLGNIPLKELSLAKNPISQLGEVLNMKELEFLNVAATNIGSFKEIGNLTRLKNLKDLRFSDPQWGDSPLALLHNYQTYILFRLRQLLSVDTVDLTEEAKQAARAMYTRKRVYYNMCIKTLQENRNNSTNPCFKAEIQRMKSMQKNLLKLMKIRKILEKEMCQELDEGTARTGDDKSAFRKSNEGWMQTKVKVATVDEQIMSVMKHLDNLRTQLILGKAKDQAAVDLNIHWLMVELDTGGNIRMEVGNSKDAWFKSCVELVVSRFFLADFVPFSITGMQVLKVTRIHNRFLEDRFQRTLDGHTRINSKMHVEYLLYGETLQAPDELQCIIEEGFPFSVVENSPNNSSGPVLLSNSIGLADMCRLQAIAEQSSNISCRGKTTGWLLVVKTCLGASVRDVTHAHTRNPRTAIIVNGVLQRERADFPPATKASYPHADSVFRTHPQDSSQRSWSVFNATTVVPEYLVEFEYSFKESDSSKLDPVVVSLKTSKNSRLTNGRIEDAVSVGEHEANGKCQFTRTETECPYSYDLVPGLLNLNLRSNPVVDEPSYQDLVLQALPLLAELDCKTITTDDRVAAVNKYCPQPPLFPTTIAECDKQPAAIGVSPSLNEQDQDNYINILRSKPVPESADGKPEPKPVERIEKVLARSATLKSGGQKLGDPFRLSPYRLNQFTKFYRIETASKKKSLHSAKEGPATYEGVEEVHLENRKLRTMYCFDRLPNLRRLFLSGNEISVIAGLDSCTMLEELILDDNVIKQGIEGLISLLELYAQNNQLTKMTEIQFVRDLPKLMVVNFCGNAFCEDRDYRLYTVYSIRKLKVLDSVNVNSQELTEARNKYTGRLQKETVEEIVGHKHYETVQVLDLAEQKIRHCGDVFESPEFQYLRELNLNNNMISSLHPLRYLSSLIILRLENNNIENGPLLQPPSVSTSPETGSEGERQGKTVNSVASTSRLSLESLEVLELSGNSISNIMSLRLSKFSTLKHLSLQDNKITKVDGLENLRHLEYLYLNHNSIKELDPGSFANLQNLRILHLGDNSLKTLVHLGGLNALESLDLTSNLLTPNRLGGFASIDYLSPLPKLTKLWLNNNPMSRQNYYRISVISRLDHLEQLDGRPVSQEERQEAEAYSTGKEPSAIVVDPNVLYESPPNSMTVCGQIKVPLKVTSMNFDTICASQASKLNGLRGYGLNQASTQNATYNSLKHWEQMDAKQVGSLVRKGSKGENKLLMLPFQTFLKTVTSGKERIP